MFEISIGSGSRCDLVGYTDDISEAKETAEEAINRTRDRLAGRLAESGGLGAELAYCRDRWPEPQIHFVPEAVNRAAEYDRLRRLYEELRDQTEDDKTDDADPDDADPTDAD